VVKDENNHMNTQLWWKQSYEHPDVVKTIIWTPRCGERWKQSLNTQMWWKVKQSYEHPDVVKDENNHMNTRMWWKVKTIITLFLICINISNT